MGDALARSQATQEMYEAKDTAAVGHALIEDACRLLHEEDPSLLFPVLLWALNSGTDATLLAEVISPRFLDEQTLKTEKSSQEQLLHKHRPNLRYP